MPELALIADLVILVYAVRWALASSQAGSHAPLLVSLTIRRNADRLPAAARAVLVREVCGWLDGRGITAPAEQRQPWCDALDALGVRRTAGMRVVLDDTPPRPAPVPAPRQRRRGDRLDTREKAAS